MKNLLAVFLMMVCSIAYGQSIQRNNFTTNTGPQFNGSGLTNLLGAQLMNATLVSPIGSDVTGKTNDWQHPFLTCTAAKNASTTGSLIVVNPGVYNENNLAKNGINWYWYNGATNKYTGSDDSAIWDDKDSAINFNVDGHGTFIWYGSSGDFPTSGDILIENAGTIASITCDRLQGGGDNTVGTDGLISGAWIVDCTKVIINCNSISCIDNTGDHEFGGIYWMHGLTEVRCHDIDLPEGPCIGLSDQNPPIVIGTSETSLYVQCDEMFATNASGDGTPTINCYINNPLSREWIVCPHIGVSGTGAPVMQLWGSSKIYVTSQKIDDQGNVCAVLVNAVQDNLGIVWIDSEKVSSKTLWLNQNGNNIKARVLNWEDQGGSMSKGFLFLSNTIAGGKWGASIDGGSALLTNAPCIVFNTNAGNVYFKDMNIDTATTSTAGNYGADVSGSGLSFMGCSIVVPTISLCLHSSGATVQTLGLFSNQTNSTAITLSPNGGFYQNTSIK